MHSYFADQIDGLGEVYCKVAMITFASQLIFDVCLLVGGRLLLEISNVGSCSANQSCS
jgi:hypothetical protein